MNTDQDLPPQISNIFHAFELLKGDVLRACRTQIGDAARLRVEIDACDRLLAVVHQHRVMISEENYTTISQGIAGMIQDLTDAINQSMDLPDRPPANPVTLLYTGKPGRPKKVIAPDLLAAGMSVAGPSSMGRLLDVSSRTVRRRALEAGLVEAGDPVYVDYVSEDGQYRRVYTSSTGPQSNLSDEQLDDIMRQLLDIFPSFGRRMIDGYFSSQGYKVPRARLEACYKRVHGPSTTSFGQNRIHRRVYKVTGYNSLWHHDGQHGLIRWKIVIHGFIDGHTRLIVGIRAHNNNRADTVDKLFVDITSVHGYPCRLRGDHGVENVMVANRMEQVRGANCGAYIWGRSVHNIRIERLWVDFTRGIGKEWKIFFDTLESTAGLNVDSDEHIWLIHYLFLEELNAEILVWAEVWNNHKITTPGIGSKSPKELKLWSITLHGTRGITDPIPEGELSEYGIDWDDHDNPALAAHHDRFNPTNAQVNGPLVTQRPEAHTVVEVEEPNCPLHATQLAGLTEYLQSLGDTYHDRKMRWILALAFCRGLVTM
ncbi:hypothetical protein QCA50_000700 [Cerrena zonata]|uniref:Integrase core domain-containing protein n=1 Tax=Cerrena zonata TaxID=2478898 RepID=A0AAW0GVF6_9APHY